MKTIAKLVIFLFVVGGYCLGHHMALHPSSSMISVMIMPFVLGIGLAVDIVFPKKDKSLKQQ